VRGDHRPVTAADFEVVQNAAQADSRRRFFVPHWSQPGLLPRDPARGARIERAAFKGFSANLHPGLASADWREALARRGIEWVADVAVYRRSETPAERLDWNDFRAVDAVVALRPARTGGHLNKPATKLYNAWRAGVPAVLGREAGFRELRQSELTRRSIWRWSPAARSARRPSATRRSRRAGSTCSGAICRTAAGLWLGCRCGGERCCGAGGASSGACAERSSAETLVEQIERARAALEVELAREVVAARQQGR
jgi:hypothetical protein